MADAEIFEQPKSYSSRLNAAAGQAGIAPVKSQSGLTLPTRTENEVRAQRQQSNGVFDMLTGIARLHAMPKVYPGYIALRLKKLLQGAGDPEGIIASVGDMQTIGDGKYAIAVKDFEGTEYSVTVEVRS